VLVDIHISFDIPHVVVFQYYNAEVTGVSERTCVVRFVEYGNYEEVLQDDCIPFTEVRYDVFAVLLSSSTTKLWLCHLYVLSVCLYVVAGNVNKVVSLYECIQ
jgi:hypothetical protein